MSGQGPIETRANSISRAYEYGRICVFNQPRTFPCFQSFTAPYEKPNREAQMPLVFSRRQLLIVAVALPALGCALDSSGIPGRNTDTTGGTETPFAHAAVLNIVALKDVETTYTLHVTFSATVTGVGVRTHSQSFKKDELQPGFVVKDFNVIDLGEAGTVICECKFIFDVPADAEENSEHYDVTHTKVANEPLPEFNLNVVNAQYVLS